MKYSGIGGQAVIEGIMMMKGEDYAVAVRRSDKEIEVKKDTYQSITKKAKILQLPFVRGVFRFADSMIIGMRSLTYSASFFEDDEDAEPGKFEQFLDRVFGEKLESAIMAAVLVISFILAIGIFMLLPLGIANLFKGVITSDHLMAVLEGVIRIAIFIIYIKLVSRMEDIRRTFMYHGAEHKCINCIEHGMTLTVDHVRESSKQHKRCGTSFLIIVMLISILFFMVVRVDNVWLRMVSRIILVPVIAGVSYEFLRLAGRSDNPVVNLLSKPGLWMQNLTTSEPDDSMIEVAIAAVEAVFDWKAYLRENFPETEIPETEDAEALGDSMNAKTEIPETEDAEALGDSMNAKTEIPETEAKATGQTTVQEQAGAAENTDLTSEETLHSEDAS